MKIQSIIAVPVERFKKLALFQKILLIAVLVGLGWFTYTKVFTNKSASVAYQTATAQKGTLIVTVAGSGQVSSVNSESSDYASFRCSQKRERKGSGYGSGWAGCCRINA